MTISRELWIAYTRIFFVEAAYWIISIGMVFVNEYVLSDSILTDDLTIFITIFQILFSLAILVTLNYLTKHYLDPTFNIQHHEHQQHKLETSRHSRRTGHDDREKERLVGDANEDDEEEILFVSVNAKLIERDSDGHRHTPDEMPEDTVESGARRKISTMSYAEQQSDKRRPANQDSLMQLLIVNIPHRINLETCKVVFPLSILYIGMLLLNNFCLKNVGVAFYFVSRSLTTVFNVVFTYFLINEPVSRGALICCGFIVLGFILGIDQENVIGSLSVIGVSFGVASSLFGSLCSIYTKKTLAKLDKNIWVLVLYNNINAIVLCTPLLIVHGDIQSLISDKVIQPSFWLFLSISGVMAFFISIVTNASIKYTSPLTHNISGTAKACFQTVIAVIYSHDHKSTLWWISNITILVASAMYSRIKQQEMESRTAASRTQTSQNSNSQGVSSDKLLAAYKLNGTTMENHNRSHQNDQKRDQRRDSSSSGCSATSDRQPIQKGDTNQRQQGVDGQALLPLNIRTDAERKECCSVEVQSAT